MTFRNKYIIQQKKKLIMKYVKTFENFNYPLNEELFSKTLSPEQIAKMKELTNKKLSEMSAKDKEAAAKELVQFAKKHGIQNPDDLKDSKKVEASLQKDPAAGEANNQKVVADAVEQGKELVGESLKYQINENWLMDKLKQAGNWLAKWLWKIGLGMVIAAIIVAIIVSAASLAPIIASVSIIVSFITLGIGGAINQAFGDNEIAGVASAAAAARRGPSSFR